jgi:hypothetical protein
MPGKQGRMFFFEKKNQKTFGFLFSLDSDGVAVYPVALAPSFNLIAGACNQR